MDHRKLPLNAIVLLGVLVLIAIARCADSQDASEGLDCTKDSNGKVIVCTGKNKLMNDSEGKIKTIIQQDSTDLQTKIKTVETKIQTGGSGGQRYPTRCPSSGCETSVNTIHTPTLLYNNFGQARFVLQQSSFNQYVYLAVCKTEKSPCGRRRTCEQKQMTYTLLVWDPFYPDGGLYVEDFNVPSGCCCTGN